MGSTDAADSSRASPLVYYVSTPTGRRCLKACREHGFREMACPVKLHKGVLKRRSLTVHLEHFALDNGAWLYHVGGLTADFGPFAEAMAQMGATADFCVVPDRVAGGLDSLRLSESWLPRVLDHTKLALIPVQDGMDPEHLRPFIGPRVGIFLGGSFRWKWTTADSWAHFAHETGTYIHVGRVNTRGRAEHCANLGIHSADGSSVSRFSITASRFKEATRADRHAQIHLRLGS